MTITKDSKIKRTGRNCLTRAIWSTHKRPRTLFWIRKGTKLQRLPKDKILYLKWQKWLQSLRAPCKLNCKTCLQSNPGNKSPKKSINTLRIPQKSNAQAEALHSGIVLQDIIPTKAPKMDLQVELEVSKIQWIANLQGLSIWWRKSLKRTFYQLN